MRRSTFCWGALAASIALGFSSGARAEQFIVTDVTYTHSAQTTSDSHYHVNPSAGTPANWSSPINYAGGSAHVLLEVKTKPNATPTKFQICFEGSPSYACTDQSIAYTAPGKYEWTTKFANFYYGGTVDWSKGISKVALILKDTNNGKPQGDPNYVPTDLRVEVAIVSPGASYVSPLQDAGTSDAGASDAGTSDAGASDAGAALRDAGRDAGREPVLDASSASTRDAEASATADSGNEAGPGTDASGAAEPRPIAVDAGARTDEEKSAVTAQSDGGCRLAERSDPVGALLGLALLFLPRVRRRRR